MNEAIFVIDVQKDIIGDDRNFYFFQYKNKRIIENINEYIKTNKDNQVIYIKHKMNLNKILKKMFKYSNTEVVGDNFATNLNIVGNKIYDKTKASALSNKKLLNYLLNSNIKVIKILGVDLCWCINKTINDLKKHNFKIILIENCCDTLFEGRWKKLKQQLLLNNILIK